MKDDFETDNIDNTLSAKQQKRRRTKIIKWIEKEIIDNIRKNKGIAWVGGLPCKDKDLLKELKNEK